MQVLRIDTATFPQKFVLICIKFLGLRRFTANTDASIYMTQPNLRQFYITE